MGLARRLAVVLLGRIALAIGCAPACTRTPKPPKPPAGPTPSELARSHAAFARVELAGEKSAADVTSPAAVRFDGTKLEWLPGCQGTGHYQARQHRPAAVKRGDAVLVTVSTSVLPGERALFRGFQGACDRATHVVTAFQTGGGGEAIPACLTGRSDERERCEQLLEVDLAPFDKPFADAPAAPPIDLGTRTWGAPIPTILPDFGELQLPTMKWLGKVPLRAQGLALRFFQARSAERQQPGKERLVAVAVSVSLSLKKQLEKGPSPALTALLAEAQLAAGERDGAMDSTVSAAAASDDPALLRTLLARIGRAEKLSVGARRDALVAFGALPTVSDDERMDAALSLVALDLGDGHAVDAKEVLEKLAPPRGSPEERFARELGVFVGEATGDCDGAAKRIGHLGSQATPREVDVVAACVERGAIPFPEKEEALAVRLADRALLRGDAESAVELLGPIAKGGSIRAPEAASELAALFTILGSPREAATWTSLRQTFSEGSPWAEALRETTEKHAAVTEVDILRALDPPSDESLTRFAEALIDGRSLWTARVLGALEACVPFVAKGIDLVVQRDGGARWTVDVKPAADAQKRCLERMLGEGDPGSGGRVVGRIHVSEAPPIAWHDEWHDESTP